MIVVAAAGGTDAHKKLTATGQMRKVNIGWFLVRYEDGGVKEWLRLPDEVFDLDFEASGGIEGGGSGGDDEGGRGDSGGGGGNGDESEDEGGKEESGDESEDGDSSDEDEDEDGDDCSYDGSDVEGQWGLIGLAHGPRAAISPM